MLDWVITIGFIGCLGLGAGVFIHFIKSGLDSSDMSRIDPSPKADSDLEPEPKKRE